MGTRAKRTLTIVGAVLSFLIVGIVLHRQLLPYALIWLDVGEQPRKADAIFVLLGGDDVRPFAAAALQKTGYAPEILLSATSSLSPSKYYRPKHLAFRDIMLQRGVPDSAIRILGDQVRNTMHESEVLGQYLEDHPQATVLVVTSNFHTRRTRWSLRHRLGSDAARLHMISTPHDDFDHSDWWLFPGGFEYVLMEYIKLLAYWFLYGNALWYVGGLLAACLLWCGWRWRRKPIEDGTIAASQS